MSGQSLKEFLESHTALLYKVDEEASIEDGYSLFVILGVDEEVIGEYSSFVFLSLIDGSNSSITLFTINGAFEYSYPIEVIGGAIVHNYTQKFPYNSLKLMDDLMLTKIEINNLRKVTGLNLERLNNILKNL